MLVQVIDIFDDPALLRAGDAEIVDHRRGAGHIRTARRRRRAGRPADRISPPSAAPPAPRSAPPSRQASICTTSIAPRMMNCLNMMRFWHISPVATCTGATASRILRWPSMSSGLVGSSMNHGLAKRERLHPVDRLPDLPDLVGVDHQLAVGPDHLAGDVAAGGCRPRGSRPTFILMWLKPCVDRLAAEPRRACRPNSRASRRRWCSRDSLRLELGDALGLAGSARREQIASASSGVMQSVR